MASDVSIWDRAGEHGEEASGYLEVFPSAGTRVYPWGCLGCSVDFAGGVAVMGHPVFGRRLSVDVPGKYSAGDEEAKCRR